MTLDEAIKHAEEVAEEQEELYRLCPVSESEIFHCDGTKDCKTLENGKNKGCKKCAEEHRQLAEWLKELKELREQTRWIPVSERLPEIDEPVLIFQRYYSGANITIGRYHSGEDQGGYRYWQWIKYDNHFSYGIDHFGIICPDSYYVDAWMPLPEPYDPQEQEG